MARSRIMFMFVPMCRYEGYAGHDRRNSMAAANGLSSEHALKIAIVCNRTMQSLRCLHGSLFRNIGKAQQQRTPRIDLERVTGKRWEGEAWRSARQTSSVSGMLQVGCSNKCVPPPRCEIAALEPKLADSAFATAARRAA